MDDWVLRIPLPRDEAKRAEILLEREWLVANGLGGYASGTVAGVITRRYHGLLTAALGPPLGRTVMLSHVAEEVRFPNGRRAAIGGRARSGDVPDARGVGFLVEFRLECGLPVWRYDVHGLMVEKRVFMPHTQNTVHLLYDLVAGADEIELALRPSVNFRAQDAPVSEPLGSLYEFHASGDEQEISLAGSPFPAGRRRSP